MNIIVLIVVIVYILQQVDEIYMKHEQRETSTIASSFGILGSVIAESSADLLHNDTIRILGLFDTENWEWGEELFTTTSK